jgi:predicted phosphate transport protein (TIGR00153 family)
MTSNFVQDRHERRGMLRLGLRRFGRRDRRFSPLFNSHAQLCVEGLTALTELLADVRDPAGRVRQIEAIEKRADSIVSETRLLLRRSILPPFPRPAIHALVNRLDDILDLAEDVAQSLHLYHVTAITPEARRLADLAVKSAIALQAAVAGLAAADDPRPVLALCEEVDSIEAQADHVYRSAMSKLFREEPDTRQLVKLKAIYELLEELTDKCKNAAAEVQSLALR